jgi:arylsulfatase A-like enzyme
VRYIKEQDGKQPFYLYLTFNAPHTPYQAPEAYIKKYSKIKDPTRRTYASMIDCLDENIGKVVKALDKKGLRKNTLILFHSDNGGTKNAMFAGQMADMSKVTIPCDNGPYRDGKGTLLEGGTLVAACANWPGRIKPGSTITGLMHAVDMFPTFAALAGASTAKSKPLDGVNVWDTISAGKPSPRADMIYNVEPFRGAIRQGEWKLIWRAFLPSGVDLYNLADDPYEKTNVAKEHPDKVAALQARLEAAAAESAKPLSLIWVIQHGLDNTTPLLPTDEAFYTDSNDDSAVPNIAH